MGPGFIGSHVVDALVGEGHELRVLDALAPDVHPEFPDYLDPRAELRAADCVTGAAVRRAIRGVDAVCHQAAKVGLGLGIADITAYVADNDLGTAMLLGPSRPRGSPDGWCSRAAWSSTARAPTVPYPRPERAAAADPCRPRCGFVRARLPAVRIGARATGGQRVGAAGSANVYAATKLHQEHLCFAFSRETAVPVTALRYHNVYGPRMPRDTPYAGVASIFVSALAAGQRRGSSRTGASCATSSTCAMSRAPTCWR